MKIFLHQNIMYLTLDLFGYLQILQSQKNGGRFRKGGRTR